MEGSEAQNYICYKINSARLTRSAYDGNTVADGDKNAVLLASDATWLNLIRSASSVLQQTRWTVSCVGNMSNSVDTMLDLDLQTTTPSMAKKTFLMIILQFSLLLVMGLDYSQIHAAAVVKKLHTKKTRLLLFGSDSKDASDRADLATKDFAHAIQWFQTSYETISN